MTPDPNKNHSNISRDQPELVGRLLAWLEPHARWVLAVYWVCLAAGTHWPNLEVFPPTVDPQPLDHVLKFDKVLHAAGFGGLMVLLILAGLGGRDRPWRRRCNFALWVAVGFSLLDELTQGFMPGRTVSLSDMVTNLLAVVGVYIVAVLPAEQAPAPLPRRVGLAFGLSVPLMAVLALSPGVMRVLLDLRDRWRGVGTLIDHPMDHVMHGVLAALLAWGVIRVWPMTRRRPRAVAALALLLVVITGPGLEVAQHFTGRTVQWQDALAHAIGVLLAMMVWAGALSRLPRNDPPGGRIVSNASSRPASCRGTPQARA